MSKWASDIPTGLDAGNRARPVQTSPPAHAPLVAPTGSPGVDSVLDVVNDSVAPFMSAPPPEQGAAGWVAQGLGGVLGVMGAPQMIIDTAFASLTGPIAALFPGMPALTLGAMHVGPPHAHAHPPSLIPPAPPVPLPSLGVTVGSGAVTVLIGGLPAARAGDIGLAVTCGSLAPPFEIYTGSSNVFIGGARVARMLDITKHCNPTSMGPFAIAMGAAGVVAGAAGAIATGNAYAAAQAAADAAVLAVKLLCGKDPGVPPGMGALVGPPVGNVLIGGFPCPPIGEMAMGGIMKLIGKAAKAVKNARNARRGNGTCADGVHPVYLPTGEVFDSFVDFVSGGLFEWRRHYTSARCKADGPLGFGWRHSLQRSLTVRLHRAVLTDWDGERIEFPRFLEGASTTTSDGYTLHRLARGRYRVTVAGAPAMEFVGDPFGGELPLVKLSDDVRDLDVAYDARGLLSACVETDRRSPMQRRRWEFSRDAYGHIDRVVEVGAGQPIVRCAYAYDEGGALAKVQDALGGISAYEYGPFRRLKRSTDQRGYSFTFDYDVWGRCIRASGQDGLWAGTMEYVPDERLTRLTEGDGATYEFHWDADGFITKIVDPYGGERLRERDAEGRVVAEIDSGGRALRWAYDGSGTHRARVDEFGCLFPPEPEMPVLDEPLARTLPACARDFHWGGLANVGEDALLGAGPQLLADIPAGFTATARATFRLRPEPPSPLPAPIVEHDALGRLRRTVDRLGREQRWTWDAAGNLVATQDRDGRVTRQRIASWDLVAERVDPLGHSMRFRHSQLELVIGISDPLGNASRYDYDLKERLVRVHRNGRVRDEYVYDTGDHFVEKRDGDGNLLFTNVAHANHFVGVRRLASGGEHRFDYDWKGRIIEASTAEHDVHLDYDGHDVVASDVRDGRGVVHSRYGARAWRTRVLERFETIADEAAADTTRIRTPDGSTLALRLGEDGIVHRVCGNGTREWLQYDADGRLEARLYVRADGCVWTVRYTYSAEGDLLHVADSQRGASRFETDEAHRLVRRIDEDGRVHAYEHDAAGNLLAAPWATRLEIAAGNRLAASASEVFAYDARDHLAMRRGRDGSRVRYRYDSFDMLVAIERESADGTPLPPWTAEYDALGRRIRCGVAGAEREFWWDGDRLGAELAPDGQLRIYHYAGDAALVPWGFTDYASVADDPASGRTYWLFTDPVGMPLHVEDAEGRVVWWAARTDPYGTIEVAPQSSIELRLRWPGHVFDGETGLHYNRWRYYDPALGRYLQSDPIGYGGGDNLYAYCANPVVHVDVLGLTCSGRGKPGDRKGSSDNEGREQSTARPRRRGGDPNAPKKGKQKVDVDGDGLTDAQRAYFRKRIDSGGGDQARYDRNCCKRDNLGKEHLTPTEWKDSTANVRGNSHRGSAHEAATLDAAGVENNNNGNPPKTYKTPAGGETRPDAVTDKAVIDVKSKPDEGGVVNNSDQLEGQARAAKKTGREHVVVIANGDKDSARPSGPLADQSTVLHRDPETGRWSKWEDGGWKPSSQEEAKKIMGGK